MMAAPYEKSFRFSVDSANDIVRLDFPSRVSLKKIAAVHESGTQFSMSVYNRAFTATGVSIDKILDSDGNAKVYFDTRHGLQVGDIFDVTGSDVAGYNTTHRVTEVIDEKTLVTDQSFTSAGYGGDGSLNMPSVYHDLYLVIPEQSSDPAGVLTAFTEYDGGGVVFVNQDAQNHMGHRRFIYVKMNKAGTYRMQIAANIEVD